MRRRQLTCRSAGVYCHEWRPPMYVVRLEGGLSEVVIIFDSDGTGLWSAGRIDNVRARLLHPDVIDRTTGAVRDTGAFVELPPRVLADLLAALPLSGSREGLVAAVLVHQRSRRAVVVGPFAGVAEAWRWWLAPCNRLALNSAMAAVVLPCLGSVSRPEEG